MTLNGGNGLLVEIESSYGAQQKNLNEDRHKLSAAECSSMSLLSGPIISGLGKATNFKFGRYIQSVHANKSLLKIWENMERGRIQRLPKFLE